MSLRGSLFRLHAARGAKAARRKLKPSQIKRIAEQVAKQMQPMARRFIQANFRKSGLNTRSGELRQAISRSSFFFVLAGGKKPILIAALPSATSLVSSDTQEDYRAKVNSLNKQFRFFKITAAQRRELRNEFVKRLKEKINGA